MYTIYRWMRKIVMDVDPISNQMFSDDFQRFVLQKPHCRVVHGQMIIPKPFDLNFEGKTKKTKKDMKKNKKNPQEASSSENE